MGVPRPCPVPLYRGYPVSGSAKSRRVRYGQPSSRWAEGVGKGTFDFFRHDDGGGTRGSPERPVPNVKVLLGRGAHLHERSRTLKSRSTSTRNVHPPESVFVPSRSPPESKTKSSTSSSSGIDEGPYWEGEDSRGGRPRGPVSSRSVFSLEPSTPLLKTRVLFWGDYFCTNGKGREEDPWERDPGRRGK